MNYDDVYGEFDMMDRTEESPFASVPIASESASVPIASESASVHSVTYEDMCKILIETYNTSIIDYLSPELQYAFATEAEAALSCADNDYMDDGRQRDVLAQLIINKKNLPNPYPQIDFIGGPFNITYHWSTKYRKAIYIWGEWHDERTDCPDPIFNPHLTISNIEDFLAGFFTEPIVFPDFYLEQQGYVVPDGYDYKGHGLSKYRINILRDRFGPCIDHLRNTYRQCDNSRMHFFDIRQGKVKLGMNSASLFHFEIQSFISNLEKKLKVHDFSKNCLDIPFLKIITDFIRKWKSFFIFFSRFDNDAENTKINYTKFWYDQLRNFYLVNKEISVMNADVRPLLNMFIKEEMDNLLHFDYIKDANHPKDVLKMYDRIVESIVNFKNKGSVKGTLFFEHYVVTYKDIDFLRESMNNFFLKSILPFNSVIVDAYLLARIFKTFQINGPKKRPTDEPAEPHNIIIYAGNAHSQRYRKFLKYLKFRVLEESGELERPVLGKKNCVDMSRITQPLFTNCPYHIEDEPQAIDFVGNPTDLKYSFDSMFRVDTPELFSEFDQPVVPNDLNDLSTSVLGEQGQFGEYGKTTRGDSFRNKITPYSRSSGRSKR